MYILLTFKIFIGNFSHNSLNASNTTQHYTNWKWLFWQQTETKGVISVFSDH